MKVIWIDSTHLLTTGFARSADRQVILYEIQGEAVVAKAKATLDVSPAPLFAHFDPDTSILYLYGKGERIIHIFEVQADKLARLPSYSSGSQQLGVAFLPKTAVDPYAVEVGVAYRLTPSSVERVVFSIPRARVRGFPFSRMRGLTASRPSSSRTTSIPTHSTLAHPR
jgi:coronin-7